MLYIYNFIKTFVFNGSGVSADVRGQASLPLRLATAEVGMQQAQEERSQVCEAVCYSHLTIAHCALVGHGSEGHYLEL